MLLIRNEKIEMKKIWLMLLIVLLFIAAHQLGLATYLNFDYLKNHLAQLQSYYQENQLRFILYYFLLYVFVTAISFPGATVLSLLAGAVLGVANGVMVVAFASTIGATIAFWSSRFLFREFVDQKFHAQFETINANMKKEGTSYLLTLRLIPLFPFFIVNLLMGLTTMATSTYFYTSFFGMLPGIVVFIYAGKSFSEINSIRGILSLKMLLIFFLIGLLPYISKFFLNRFKNYKLYRKFKRPKKFDYNMMVIGGGAAGLVTSYVASSVKAKVALVEKDKMGGDCLNFGCIPSKALIKTAKVIHLKNKAKELGIKKIEIDFDFKEVMERVKKIITEVEPHDSRERYQELGVNCLTGHATIISPYEVKIGDKIFTTQNITVATGASPFVPPIKGVEKINYLTSDTIWSLNSLPKNFLIIGGGPIGCELAQSFSRLGAHVTIIEAGAHLLSKEDLEVSLLIEKKFKEDGIDIRTNHQAREFVLENGIQVLYCQASDKEIRIEFDSVLIAVGRKARVEGFGLRELGINLRQNGTIETNEFLQTNFPNVFACGDVTGPYQLTHMASHQAWYCAVNGLFGHFKKFKVDYSVVSWCTYTDPEVAVVGMNESILKEKNIEYEITFFKIDELDRAIADSEKEGFVKVLTAKGTDRILGATIVASSASLMILEFVSAMKFKKGLKGILNTIHAYPSLGEANKYVAGAWLKNHSPEKILSLLEKYFNWMRK